MTIITRVVSCPDGDSLVVETTPELASYQQDARGRTRVRLFGVDAPELGQSPWGEKAHSALRNAIAGYAEVGLDIIDVDQYGRVCPEVILGRHTMHCLNHYLVAHGHVVAYRRWLGVHGKRNEYLPLEATARRLGLGFWAQSPRDIVLPKKYRWLNRRR